MAADLRQERILDELNALGRVRVARLATSLGVTEETIRRDLDTLATAGRLERVHGGAVRVASSRTFESRLDERLAENTDVKRLIARRALEFLPESGGSVLIDGGSTPLALARAIAANAPAQCCSIITNSLPAAAAFADRPDLPVYVIGGQLRAMTQAVVGVAATSQLDGVRVDVAFIGTNGIDAAHGCSTPDSAESATKAAFVDSSRQVVLLTDSSKFDRVLTHRFARLDEVDAVITDAQPPAPLASALHDAGTEVFLA